MRIAIVGSGVSGLVAAHLLRRAHEVTVFEAAGRIGGHVHTVDVPTTSGPQAVDTGFIVYNEQTYPHFTRLLADLGVGTKPAEMSFGMSCERTGIEWASRGAGSVFAQRSNALRPSFLRMLRDVLRFNREAPRLLREDADKASLGDYLAGAGYSREFVDHYAVPMGAAIWSADPETFLDFPAVTFVRFLRNHGLLEVSPSVPWRVVQGGSARYVEKLVEPFRDRIRAGEPVGAVRRLPDGVEIATGRGRERFDALVLAVHSNQALSLLEDPSQAERAVLGRIRYQENDVLLHTDESVLPRNARARASWNYRIPSTPGARVFVSYDMSRLQGIEGPTRFLVTLNGEGRVDPSRVIARLPTQHPVFDADALAAQQRRTDISGVRRTHYCGAYWGYGFHEDGVRSALAVCREIDGQA